MKKIYFLMVYLLLCFFGYLFLTHEKNENIKEYLETKTLQYQKNYNALYNNNKKFAQLIFETKIDIDEVKKICSAAVDADEIERTKLRDQLYTKLEKNYHSLKKYNIKQLHFHFPNNHTFLRMHKPAKFGDDLTNIRATVKYVNQYKKPIDGFEEGRNYNGFRFVYPLFFENKHIGSVEVSFSSFFINVQMMENFNIIGKFLVSKEVVDAKVWKSQKSVYKSSLLYDFVFEKKIEEVLKQYNLKKIPILVSSDVQTIVHKNKDNPKSFSLYDKASDTVMSFIKVQNPVSKKVVAMFVARSDASYLKENDTTYNRTLLGMFLFLSVLFIFIYRSLNEKKRLNIIVDEKTRELNKSKNQLEKQLKYIEEISITDGLTNIFNRRHFNEVFPKFINSSKRLDQYVSFLIMDVDHFKQYNDTYGHQMGDEALIRIASELKKTLKRSSDMCFRLGGEEFGILFMAEKPHEALNFANTIRTNIKNLEIPHKENSAAEHVTVSCGLVCKNGNAITSDDAMYKEADDYLYNAKHSGRDKIFSNLS